MHDLDLYLSSSIRQYIEQTYYAKINEQAILENFLQDAAFYQNPQRHVALYSDHGVVHVRDVAQNILDVLECINGILIPARSTSRIESFMYEYGVIVAYLHDIGMADFSRFGRIMHPEYASQQVFHPDFDPIIDTIWDDKSDKLVWRLLNLSDTGELKQPPKLVLREMLAMSNCHSKSKVPVTLLNDNHRLRNHMIDVIQTDLQIQYARNYPEAASDYIPDDTIHQNLNILYSDFEAEAYQWLVDESQFIQELADDVIDTLRALRCADALRQRGTVLKTSGSYEIFIDQMTANSVYALRFGTEKLYVVAVANDDYGSGEANLGSSALTAACNLHITFRRGQFVNPLITEHAVKSVANIVDDIQKDVINSFARNETHPDIKILLENVDDNAEFARLVADQLIEIHPYLAAQVHIIPSLKSAMPSERNMYLKVSDVDWLSTPVSRDEFLINLEASGHHVSAMNMDEAFEHVKQLEITQGDTLIAAGTASNFVYIPFDEGLKIIPMGGYENFSVRAWMPLGNTGVIGGTMRNATVVSDRDMVVLRIPKEVYLQHWHRPYTLEEFIECVKKNHVDIDIPIINVNPLTT